MHWGRIKKDRSLCIAAEEGLRQTVKQKEEKREIERQRERDRDRYPTENNVWMYEGRKK